MVEFSIKWWIRQENILILTQPAFLVENMLQFFMLKYASGIQKKKKKQSLQICLYVRYFLQKKK